MTKMQAFLAKPMIAALVALILSSAPASAGCAKLDGASQITLTRDDPFFKVAYDISPDGTVTEQRDQATRDGGRMHVTTTYWAGVIPVDRKVAGRARMVIDEAAKEIDLSKPGLTYRFPVVITVNGSTYDRGTLVIQTKEKAKIKIGSCRYKTMVVRTWIDGGTKGEMREQAYLSLDAGVILGSLVMNKFWTPDSGVLFDEISVE